jgi:hypothetical protein
MSEEFYDHIKPFGFNHRVSRPLLHLEDGREVWIYNNMAHRLKGPAITSEYSQRIWYLYGHRALGRKSFLNKSWRRRIMLQQMV